MDVYNSDATTMINSQTGEVVYNSWGYISQVKAVGGQEVEATLSLERKENSVYIKP